MRWFGRLQNNNLCIFWRILTKEGGKTTILDHIYPISMGYKEKIPPEKVGNIKNLRFIHYTENLDKGSKITNESRNALRRIKRLKK